MKIINAAGVATTLVLAVGFDSFSATANIPDMHGWLSCAQESGS